MAMEFFALADRFQRQARRLARGEDLELVGDAAAARIGFT
jgi:hypothetical protein